MRSVTVTGLVILAFVVAACMRPPVMPDTKRYPTVVGRIVDHEFGQGATKDVVTFVLDSGREVAIDVRLEAEQLLTFSGPDAPDSDGASGGLLFWGEDAGGVFYGSAINNTFDVTTDCFRVAGPGYDLGDEIVLSSGLVLAKAPGYEVTGFPLQDVEPMPIFEKDGLCLDEAGRVTEASIAPTGY